VDRKNSNEPLPESGMGGASDAGAHGKHPASSAKVHNPTPDDAVGDAAIERRRRHDPNYGGPERRMGAMGDARA
jgi:hypothetical protein